MSAPFCATLALTAFPLAPILHLVFTRFMARVPFPCATLTRFARLACMQLVLAAFASLMVLPRLLLRLARGHMVIAPTALLAVVPARRTPVVLGNMPRLFMFAPSIMVAIVTAIMVGKSTARQQRNR